MSDNRRNSLIIGAGILALSIFFISCLFSSCGKTSVLPSASNIDYQVINLSPDILPVDLYIDQLKKNSASYYYPTPSGYFALSSIDTPFQIRSASTLLSGSNLISDITILKNNVNYTLFIMGLKAYVRPQDTITHILTVDTTAVPTIGRGKVRFINTSVGSTGVDISANGTIAFGNIPYKTVSKYVELPAGNYDFKAFPTGVTTTILTDYPGVTIQDGKVYTLYSRGIVARTDSAAFGLAIFNNRNTTTGN